MAKTYTYPHWETSVIDKSIYTPLVREQLPLFLPIFFMRCQQGPVGVPVYVTSYTEAKDTFGEGTFDMNTEYFSREALYLNQLFARQGAFITRMASSDATYGSMVLELTVKNVQVPQYERDSAGQFKLDADTGAKIPVVDASSGAQVTEAGVELKWTTRTLTGTETIKNLHPVTYGTGENAYTVYPILAAKATSVGAFANDTGIKFYVDLDDIDDTLANNVGSIPYTFGGVKKTYGQDTVSAIQSTFQDNTESFVAKPDQTDSRTDRNVSFNDIIENYYEDLPYEMHLYSDNVKTVGAAIQAVEPDDDTIADDPFLVNLTEAYNIEGVPMPHVVMSEDDDAIALNSTRILYLAGGADGDISDAGIEALTRQYLKDLVYPELLDQPRYPFTDIVDTGVSIETKKAFIQFLGKHDAFKVILATQNANLGRFNTKAEDYSTGSSLYAACLLQPESTIKGTECCRAEIYQQAGYIADSNYRGIIPSTLDVMLKKSQWQSTGAIQGQAAGLPNSEISIFKEWNWTPCDADHKQRSWDSGLNYFQYFDMTGIHWPAMRTVYRYDTSVLANALFTDCVIYAKHLARYNWSRFVGLEIEFSRLAARATAALSNDLSAMLNGFFRFSVEFSQSEEEAAIGYISHATIKLWGNPQQRVWKIDIECYRNGFDPTATEEA